MVDRRERSFQAHAVLARGAVAVDEQHRFGVDQRALLAEKNKNSHVLVMSATPIPRSLALVMYGDLKMSKIDEMPPGRQKVDTFLVDESYRERLDGFIKKQVDDGGQVYIVCPAVEEEENEKGELDMAAISIFGEEMQAFAIEEFERKQKPPLRFAALRSGMKIPLALNQHSRQMPGY